MKIKNLNCNYSILHEGGLSRIWQYVHDANYDFAIIGSQDKDTKEDRQDELLSLIKQLHLGYKKLEGKYTYDNGDKGLEISYLVPNISLNDALSIAREINQESIIWKSTDYFGFINCATGKPDGKLSMDAKNMQFSKEATDEFSSRLAKKSNAGQEFVFTMESLRPFSNWEKTLVGNKAPIKEELFAIRVRG